MAVQAQYPSNVLLLNRAAQEGKNPLSLSNHEFHQLQAHTGGSGGEGGGAGAGGGFSFFDQSIMSSFNHGVGGTITSNTSRKRGREMQLAGGGGGGGTSMMNMNRPLISIAPQIDLTQQQRNSVSIGLGLTFGEHQHHQQPPPPPQHSISLSPQSSAQSSVLLSILSDDLASHIKQQRDEMDHFILVQGEQLRRTLAEKRQRHYRSLLSAAEESVARRLREKEAEVEKASRRNAELQAKAAQLNMEAQAWQHRAKMQENMAANLHAQLERAIITSGGGGGALQEREEYSGAGVVGGGDAEDAESAYIDPDRVVERPGPPCKACRNRAAAVVVLPCRHVSLCTECDAVAQNCPLCLGVRTSSLEVFLP